MRPPAARARFLEWKKLLGKLDLSDRWAGPGAAHVAGQIWGGSSRTRFIRDTAARLVALCYQIPRDFDTCLDSSHAELPSARESLNC
eukprot:scaffold12488_cov66-Phaeocystis_antarctica.AAC.1